MATKKNERLVRVTKSHDGLDLDDTISVVGDPDPRTAALLEEGYFEWVGEVPAQRTAAEDASIG